MTETDIRDALDRIENKLDMALNGPSDQPERGLRVRVDRLERVVGTMSKLVWTGLAAGVTSLVGILIKSMSFGSGTPGPHP